MLYGVSEENVTINENYRFTERFNVELVFSLKRISVTLA